MKLKRFLTMAFLTAPLAGCLEGPLFCDVEEPRVFPSEDVLTYRVENDRDNVERDVRTNENFEEYCS